jgi:glycerophosphoryl diester phosphodiesterase
MNANLLFLTKGGVLVVSHDNEAGCPLVKS